MKRLSVALVLVAFLGGFAPPLASAQTSLDDIEAKLSTATDELRRVDAILADSDANKRVAGMQLLLASDNPVFVKRAREAGLFSSDPYMREAALKAILDAGGSLTFVLDTRKLSKDNMEAWLDKLSEEGPVAADGSSITLTFNVGPYVEESNCYVILTTTKCFLTRDGTSLALGWWFFRTMQGRVSLSQDGKLVGELSLATNNNPRGTVPVVADLMN